MSSPGFPPYLRNDSVPIDFNCTQGIQWVWVILRQCAVSPKEIAGVSLGLLSAVVWIVFLIPQIVENYRKGIPDKAISPTLLACFIIGDSFNLVGCLLTHQLPLQTVIAATGVICDSIQICQFMYYKSKHAASPQNMVEISTADESNGGGVAQGNEGLRSSPSLPIFCVFGIFCLTESSIYPHQGEFKHLPASRQLLSLESKTPFFVSPQPLFPNKESLVGYVLGWISATVYLSSRLPQIIKNWKRGTTEGLSPIVFVLSVIGNLAYGLQIFLTSVERNFLIRSLPWVAGSFGVLIFDTTICLQFYWFRRRDYDLLNEDTAVSVV
uniref:PQ-loop repeat family protein / transmembrane family protein n=1 Tax=Mesocestoides corti TaxID=53468 RepID=A0A5K3ESM8_MESCO